MLEPAVAASLIAATGAICGALLGVWGANRLGQEKRRSELQTMLHEELKGQRDEMDYLRQALRRAQRSCDDVSRAHVECERRLTLLSVEVATLKGIHR